MPDACYIRTRKAHPTDEDGPIVARCCDVVLDALGRGSTDHDGALHDVVYLSQVIFGEIELGGGGGALDVLWPTSADYGDVYRRVCEGPGYRELGDGVVRLVGEPL
jgi:hypothetical protein